MKDMAAIKQLLEDAKSVARKYKKLTGKPLGITGEVAEFTAATLLGLELSEVRQAGYDAIKNIGGVTKKVQIKGRSGSVKFNPSARLGAININKEWDTVVLVLLDENYEPFAMHEADRKSVTEALTVPGSKARNERGQLGIGKFISIGKQVWP